MELEDINSFSLLSPEKLILGDFLYARIKEAILKGEEKATLFIATPILTDTSAEGIVFTVDKNQFPIFLDKYLKMCESEELFELCTEILDLRSKILKIENENRGN